MARSGACGSSPRTWGIPPHLPHRLQNRRFIPTNVGNTASTCPTWTCSSVHPHERGEYEVRWHQHPPRNGSSPRTWGIHQNSVPDIVSFRFIPTNVGNTRSYLERKITHVGSSPRTWGIQSNAKFIHRQYRFIPTNVGNTISRTIPTRSEAVHPHERGEYDFLNPDDLGTDGSSPRTWGILYQRAGIVPHIRFIPTNVGNTQFARGGDAGGSVHPHERGEY